MKKRTIFEMYRSRDFFTCLRGAMRTLGLAWEEILFGVGVYFIAASRVFENPLRLNIEESTEGSADYIVGKVMQLLQPGNFVEIPASNKQAWSRFAENPAHRAVYLPDGDRNRSVGTGVRFEVLERQLKRVTPVKKEGRVWDRSEHVEGAFACISADHEYDPNYAPRWLTMRLGSPQKAGEKVGGPMDEGEFGRWHQVQKLIQERAQRGIAFPEWADLVVEHSCAKDRTAEHLPAFLQAWKTMSALRSLERENEEILRPGQSHATFEDFAATGLLLRKVFREGSRFPSAKKIFERLQPAGEEVSVLNPLTGKGVRYQSPPKKMLWGSLLAIDE